MMDMFVRNIKDYTKENKSWIVGAFDESFFKTGNFEMGIHKHKAGESGVLHVHLKTHEINIILKGSMKVNGQDLKSGDMFVIPPYMVSDSYFHEDTTLIVLRDKSVLGDKFELK